VSERSPTQQPDLEKFRDYLVGLVRLQTDSWLRGKLDPSGMVQETLFEAHKALAQLRGRSEGEVLSWLRTALGHNLADEIRRLGACKRNVGREESLQQALEQSSSCLEEWLAANQTAPSEQVQRQEQALRLTAALRQLPDKQRQAVELRHLKGHSLAEIAGELNCSKAAVVGLLHRGVQKLRKLLEEESRG
jgi:RNA polymerase sigma-70 factor (ECF subfamily)